MPEKPTITITETRNKISQWPLFKIKVQVPVGGGWQMSGVSFLLKEGWFFKLIDAFRSENEEIILLSSFQDLKTLSPLPTESEIAKINDFCLESFTIYHEPKSYFILFSKEGYLEVCCPLKESKIIQDIFKVAWRSYSSHTFFFVLSNEREAFLDKIRCNDHKDLDKILLQFSRTIIYAGMWCCSAGEYFSIGSIIFNKDLVMKKICSCIDTEKIQIQEGH